MKKFTFLVLFSLACSFAFGQAVDLGGKFTTTDTLTSSQAKFLIKKKGLRYIAYPFQQSGCQIYWGTKFSDVLLGAMNQLSSGGRILIDQGTFDNCDSITVPYANITVEGAGMYLTKIKLKSLFDLRKNYLTGLFRVNGKSGFTLKNIELDGNASGQTKIDSLTSTAKVCGVFMDTRTYSGSVQVQNDVLIENCYIHDFTVTGVILQKGARNRVSKCRLENNYWNQVTSGTLDSLSVIDNCQLKGGGDAGILVAGKRIILLHNYISTVTGNHGTTNLHASTTVTGTLLSDGSTSVDTTSLSHRIDLKASLTQVTLKTQTVPFASFGSGSGMKGDSASMGNGMIAGSYYNGSTDTLKHVKFILFTKAGIGNDTITGTMYYRIPVAGTPVFQVSGATIVFTFAFGRWNGIWDVGGIVSSFSANIPPNAEVFVILNFPSWTRKPAYVTATSELYKK